MEIVLAKDYETLGKAMDVINVKEGFARNFLFPQGIAVPATEGNRAADRHQRDSSTHWVKLDLLRIIGMSPTSASTATP